MVSMPQPPHPGDLARVATDRYPAHQGELYRVAAIDGAMALCNPRAIGTRRRPGSDGFDHYILTAWHLDDLAVIDPAEALS